MLNPPKDASTHAGAAGVCIHACATVCTPAQSFLRPSHARAGACGSRVGVAGPTNMHAGLPLRWRLGSMVPVHGQSGSCLPGRVAGLGGVCARQRRAPACSPRAPSHAPPCTIYSSRAQRCLPSMQSCRIIITAVHHVRERRRLEDASFAPQSCCMHASSRPSVGVSVGGSQQVLLRWPYGPFR